jgi:hypothetical protein
MREGLPGDRVRIEAGRLYLNGAALTEPYAQPFGGPGEAPTRGDSLAEVEWSFASLSISSSATTALEGWKL